MAKRYPVFEKSFASNELSKFWNKEQNGNVEPKDVFSNAKEYYWFDCDKCNHTFKKSLNKVATGSWCLFCSNKELCKDNNCEKCKNKSFASHSKSKYWSSKNDKVPQEVFLNSHKKYLFNCDKCSHEFLADPAHVKTGNWCPYCVNKKLCDDEDCDQCFNKSFASHYRAPFWSSNNPDKPRDLFKGSREVREFKCDKCNKCFSNTLDSINLKNSWCLCNSKN
jgi:hypothetical protein